MGQYASVFHTPDNKAISKHTNPGKPNWITAHAIASELSIAEVERLWIRFQQLGCTRDGELSDEAIRKSEYGTNVFMRNILRKFMTGSAKKITFENFLRALKWVEQASLDDKIRAIYHMVNNGNPLTPDLLVKIMERVYPDDKGEPIQRIVELFMQIMDRNGKGQINEEGFVFGAQKLPRTDLERVLNFQILPEEMKERLHQNLLEFRTDSAVPGTSWGASPRGQQTQQTGRRRVVTDSALREVAKTIHRKDWVRLANRLGFFQQDIDDITDAYPDSKEQQVYQMLIKWRERDGEMADAEKLETELNRCGMNDAAILMMSY